mmetsp:Transcript_18223/g.40251  ORF Transcript_18223/g.40251 Transcript_18223/m.40251 type:complete len:238 (-) Transcript_18223:909-1622(-)
MDELLLQPQGIQQSMGTSVAQLQPRGVGRLVEGPVHLEGPVRGDMQLPANLPNKRDSERIHRHSSDLNSLHRERREIHILDRGVSQLGQDARGIGSHQGQNSQIFGDILKLVLRQISGIPPQHILHQIRLGGGGDNVKILFSPAIHGEIRHDATRLVQHAGVGDASDGLVHVGSAATLEQGQGVLPRDAQFPEGRQIEDHSLLPTCPALPGLRSKPLRVLQVIRVPGRGRQGVIHVG